MDIFYKKLDIHIQNLNEKFRAKYVIKKEIYEDIILVLHDGWGDPQFKHWARKHFKLVNNGHVNVVYSNDEVSRPVVTYEELYIKLYECHNRVGHHGRDKTWKEVKAQYSCIPYDVVMIFIKLCDKCRNRQVISESSVSKQVIPMGYLTRIHVDLIDMRHRPDGKFQWIFHVQDHVSKFSWAYPVESNEVESIAEKLLNQFYTFGPPCIFHSNNGKEFVARIIKEIRKSWTDLIIINGRVRHRQTQSLIEHDNRTLEIALEKWMQHNHTNNWSKGLGPVVYTTNTSVSKITNKTPCEVIFRQGSRLDFQTWKVISQCGIEDEENLPDNFIDKLNELHHCDISNIGTNNDLNDLENNNQLNIFNGNNQTFDLTHHPQSPTLTSVTNTIIIDDHTRDKTPGRSSRTCCSNFLDLNDNIITQDVCIGNNDINIRNLTADTPNHRHKNIQDEEVDYFQSMVKRQKLYDNAVKQQQQYQLGDFVGLQIDQVDGTNTTSSILPCKVISVHSSSNDNMIYKVCTLKGVLSTLYGVQDLLDLRKSDFSDLRGVDPTTLPTITFTEACKEYVSVGINSVVEACNCNGKCATKSCPCKAKLFKCSTKCHPKKKHACANICNYCD